MGRLRRVAMGRGVRRLGQPLKVQRQANGYLQFRLRNNDGGKNYYVHRLVARAFLGECPNGHEVHHRDHDRANNAVANLEYVTRAGNVRACVDAGRHRTPRGEASSAAKLTEDAVRRIRRLYPKVSGPKLAERFGVSASAIYAVLNGRKWTHVKSESAPNE